MPRQLKASDVESVRKMFSARQKYKCPICGGSIAYGNVTLDHCHKTGHCRGALCKSCNEGEGRVRLGMLVKTPKTNLAYKDPVTWLRSLADYLEKANKSPSQLIHPTFDMKKGKQKPVKRKKK